MARSGQAGHGSRGAGRGQSLKLAGWVVPGVKFRCCKEGAWHRGRGVGRGLVTWEQDEGARVGGGPQNTTTFQMEAQPGIQGRSESGLLTPAGVGTQGAVWGSQWWIIHCAALCPWPQCPGQETL